MLKFVKINNMQPFTKEQKEKLQSILEKFESDLSSLGITDFDIEIEQGDFYSEFFDKTLPCTDFRIEFTKKHTVFYEE